MHQNNPSYLPLSTLEKHELTWHCAPSNQISASSCYRIPVIINFIIIARFFVNYSINILWINKYFTEIGTEVSYWLFSHRWLVNITWWLLYGIICYYLMENIHVSYVRYMNNMIYNLILVQHLCLNCYLCFFVLTNKNINFKYKFKNLIIILKIK